MLSKSLTKGKTFPLIFSFLVLTFLFLIPFSFAAAPFTSTSTYTGYGVQIEHPLAGELQVNTAHEFHFHLFNANNSKPFLNNSDMKCSFHLYDPSGLPILEMKNNVTSDDIYDWVARVPAEKFPSPGTYSYVFQCNNSIEGGFYTHDIEVVPKRDVVQNAANYGDWRIFIALIVLAIILFILAIWTGDIFLTFFAGIAMLIAGVYSLIYGFETVQDFYTRAVGVILIAIGTLMILIFFREVWEESTGEKVEEEDNFD